MAHNAQHTNTRVYRLSGCCSECGRPFEGQAFAEGIVVGLTNITVNEKRVHLTQRESQIVSLLAKNYPEVTLRDRIFESTWGGDSDVDDKCLDVYCVKIRKKIKSLGFGIQNVWGVGYQLVKL